MNLELARFNMIEQQIRPWDVLDPAVLTLLSNLRREDFVPPPHRAMAFVDTQVPLLEGEGVERGACMLEPKVEARLLQELRLQPSDRVLEVGAGSGFMAALLAHRAAEVTTLEIRPELAKMARANLQRAGLSNVQVQQVDGSKGLPGAAPFDVIVLSGSVAEVPRTLLDQLAIGGRLVAVVGQLPIMTAQLFTRSAAQGFASVDLFDTVAPRLQHFGEPSRFQF